MNNIYYEITLGESIAITFSGNSRHQIPDMSFNLIVPDKLPTIPEVISPVVITYSPPPPIENMQEPPVIDADMMDTILGKESELYGKPRAVYDRNAANDGYDDIFSAISSASHGLSEQVEAVKDLLKTAPEYLKQLMVRLLRPDKLERYKSGTLISVSRLILDIERQAERFMLRYHKEAGNSMDIARYVRRHLNEIEDRKAEEASDRRSPEEKSDRKCAADILLDLIWKKTLSEKQARIERRAREDREDQSEDDQEKGDIDNREDEDSDDQGGADGE